MLVSVVVYHDYSSFRARGLCGRELFFATPLQGRVISCWHSGIYNSVYPGELAECVGCLTSVCSELSRKPSRIIKY